MEDKLKELWLDGVLQRTAVLLEGNTEADHLKVLRMNFLVLQYCKESADVIQMHSCAIKFFEEQRCRKIPASNGIVSRNNGAKIRQLVIYKFN